MMNFKKLLKGLVIAVAFFGAVMPAMASSVTVITSLDVAEIVPGLSGFTGGIQGSPPFSPPFSVELKAGDIFDYTINFKPGQQLTISNITSLWAFSYADVATDVTGTGSLSLLDSSGTALYTSNLKTDTEGKVHFGQSFNGADFTSLPTSVTFSGLHYVGKVDSYVDPDVTVRTYADPAFYFTADSYTSNAVPEPTTMLLLGLGLVGLAGTRTKFNK